MEINELTPGERKIWEVFDRHQFLSAQLLAKHIGLKLKTVRQILHTFVVGGCLKVAPVTSYEEWVNRMYYRPDTVKEPVQEVVQTPSQTTVQEPVQIVPQTAVQESATEAPVEPSAPVLIDCGVVEEAPAAPVPAPPAPREVTVGVQGVIEPEAHEPVLVDEVQAAPVVDVPPDDGAPQISVPVREALPAQVDVPSIVDREIERYLASQQRQAEKAAKKLTQPAPVAFHKTESVESQIRKLTDAERRTLSVEEISAIAARNAEIRRKK